MKITTANIKNSSYVENHEIFVGTHTGSFKRKRINYLTKKKMWNDFHYLLTGINLTDEDPHKQLNIEDIKSLQKTSRITALEWGNTTDDILIGRIEPIVKTYNTASGKFTNSFNVESGPVVGLGRFNEKLIAGLADGKIQIGDKKPTILTAGDAMSRLRQCSAEKKLVATGGKDRQNNLKVWDLERNECIFKSKNVPNDFLQLEVPIWDSDLAFIDANCLTTCSRHGYIRVYDMRKQRRPIFNFSDDKEQITYTCQTVHGNTVFNGTATGIMYAFDVRKMKHILHTYKGFTGTINDVGVDNTGKYVYTASFDRFVRVHSVESTALQYQCYVKSKATRILLRECEPVAKVKEEDETDEDITFDDSDDEEETVPKRKRKAAPAEDDDEDFDEIFDSMQTVE